MSFKNAILIIIGIFFIGGCDDLSTNSKQKSYDLIYNTSTGLSCRINQVNSTTKNSSVLFLSTTCNYLSISQFSPYLLFTAGRYIDESGYTITNALFSYNFNNGIVNRLTDTTTVIRVPSIAPDGSFILFLQKSDSSGQFYHLVKSNMDGDGQQALATDIIALNQPQISTDGTSILYSKGYDIWISNLDGTNKNLIYDSGNHSLRNPKFSPVNDRIYFEELCVNNGQNFQIFSINTDGSGKVQLTSEETGENNDFDISPDGNTIVFCSERGKYKEIYIMNSDGSNQKKLTDGTFNKEHPVYSFDGKKIAYIQSNSIYLMDPDGKNKDKIIDASDEIGQILFMPNYE